MANSLYGWGRDNFANAGINWEVDTIRAYLIDVTEYTVDIDNDQFVSDIPADARVAFAAMSGKSSSLGVCDANDTIIPTVSGNECGAIVIVKWTGDESVSPLIGYIDESDGLPIIPNGGDLTLTWSSSDLRIFRL